MKHRQQRNENRKRRLLGVVLIIMALIIMQLPATEVNAAYSSDFKMSGSTLVKYRGPDQNVTIPDTVEVIGRGAFEDNTNIELVVIPNSVKRIDPYAFWGCDNLDTVVLGNGLTEVGDYAFTGCKGLEQMTIPSNVTGIGIQAFADCVNMTDISIPAETVRIHETAFDGCDQLTIHGEEHSVAAEYAEAFHDRQKEKAEFEDMFGFTPPDSETPAATPAPTAEPVVEALLGSTQIVGNRAVFLMNGWELPVYDGLPEPENPPLADMMGSGKIPKYTVVDGEIIADHAYYSSVGLGSLMLPDGIREVGQFSFARSSLAAVFIPDGVERIDYGAFYHCDSLESVTLPDTVMCVEPKAFDYTPWVDNFLSGRTGEGDFLIEGGVLVAYRGNFLNVEIPEGVRVIAAEVFQDHTEIKSVSLPDSLRVIGEGAFEGCSQLKQIQFGQGVEEIKDRAFYGSSTLLSNVTLPQTVKKLGLQAFGNMWVNYEGEEPEHTYETSATRLSNQAYRIYGNGTAQVPGVTVVGLEGASASMVDADRGYVLSISASAENSEMEGEPSMEEAFSRSFQASIPANRMFYTLSLTDESGIPLTKLGTNILTVILPVPDTLSGQRLRLLVLDRNGQVEDVPVERVSVNGMQAIRFEANYMSRFVLYGTGEAGEEMPIEIEVAVNSLSNAPGAGNVTHLLSQDIESVTYMLPQQNAQNNAEIYGYEDVPSEGVIPLWRRLEFWVGGALFLTGVILFMAGRKKRA